MNIRHYISFFIKNVIKMLTLLIGVSIAAFMLVSLSPIDPVQANVGATAYMRMTPEKRAQMESYWGKDVPPTERYLNWAKDFVRGDMGTSLKYNRPVADVVAEKFGNSFALMCVAWVLSGILGLVLGIVAGYFKDRLPDRLIRGYALLLASTPAFWIGLLLLMIFAVWLGWLPFGMNLPAGMTTAEAHPASDSPGADTRADGRGKHHAAHPGKNDCDHGERLCAVCACARGEQRLYRKKTCPAQSGAACHHPAVWFHQ